jgi:hypothetical protein
MEQIKTNEGMDFNTFNELSKAFTQVTKFAGTALLIVCGAVVLLKLRTLSH